MPTPKKPILCVADDSDTRDLVKLILKDYEVTIAHSVAAAVKCATAVLDYRLPGHLSLINQVPNRALQISTT